MLFMSGLSIEGLGVIFAYFPYSPVAMLLLLLTLAFVPTLITEQFAFRRALAQHFAALFVISAVLPTVCQATLLSFSKRPHRFVVTAKGTFQPLRLGELLRLHAFGLGVAALFFAVVFLWMDGPEDFVTRFLGGTILMTSALIAPFALNYSKRLLGLRGIPKAAGGA